MYSFTSEVRYSASEIAFVIFVLWINVRNFFILFVTASSWKNLTWLEFTRKYYGSSSKEMFLNVTRKRIG